MKRFKLLVWAMSKKKTSPRGNHGRISLGLGKENLEALCIIPQRKDRNSESKSRSIEKGLLKMVKTGGGLWENMNWIT